MAITISNVIGGIKNPAIVSGGIMLGIGIQKGINALLNTETAQNGLGSDTALALKNYASPLITTALGVCISMSSDDDTLKKLATGVAISGPLNVGMQMFWDKNLLAGLNDGLLGFLGGDEDFDDVYVEDPDPDPEPQQRAIAGIGDLDMPIKVPATRDTKWESERMYSMGAIPPLTF